MSNGTRRSGFTLVEVAIALSLIGVTFLGFGLVFVANARSYDLVKERSLVLHSLRSMAETLRGAPFSRVASTYQGYTFTIPDINATGQVTVFLNETDTSASAALLGLPRDLDGDGSANDTSVATNYILLPVKLDVTWTNPHGPQSETLYFLLAQESN